MKKFYIVGALLLASSSAAFAADPNAVASAFAACCELALACCEGAADCCP